MSDPTTLAEPLFGSYFVSAYPPFDCWKEDALGRVHEVLDQPAARDVALGLYVHVPFCVRRCQYCYYLAHDDRAEVVERYIDALAAELAAYERRPALAERRPAFVYFGGGTPSSLSAAQIERMFASLRSGLPWDAVEEVTFECAPRSVTAEKVRALDAAGVNRVSLGVQQLDDRVLSENGRVHLAADALHAFELLRAGDFDVVNVDLMVGMMGETEKSFGESLERVLELTPESVTIYQLEIPYNTPLYRRLRDDPTAEHPASWAIKRSRLARGFARLAEAGYTARSAYTAVRDPRRQRFVYQDELYRGADLLGLGVSSFSYLAGTHFQNLARLEPYLERAGRGQLPLSRAYALTERERLVRELVLQLKLLRVELQPLREKFAADPLRVFERPLRRCVQAGWLAFDERQIALTPEGARRADRLLAEFSLPEHRD